MSAILKDFCIYIDLKSESKKETNNKVLLGSATISQVAEVIELYGGKVSHTFHHNVTHYLKIKEDVSAANSKTYNKALGLGLIIIDYHYLCNFILKADPSIKL